VAGGVQLALGLVIIPVVAIRAFASAVYFYLVFPAFGFFGVIGAGGLGEKNYQKKEN
jgi:hypothetical protein